MKTTYGKPYLQEWPAEGPVRAKVIASREDAAPDLFVVEITPEFTSIDIPVSRRPRHPHEED